MDKTWYFTAENVINVHIEYTRCRKHVTSFRNTRCRKHARLFTQLKYDYDMQTIIRQIVNNILVTTTNCRKDDLWYLCSMNALYFKKLSKF